LVERRDVEGTRVCVEGTRVCVEREGVEGTRRCVGEARINRGRCRGASGTARMNGESSRGLVDLGRYK
jgi:hypothetical protein